MLYHQTMLDIQNVATPLAFSAPDPLTLVGLVSPWLWIDGNGREPVTPPPALCPLADCMDGHGQPSSVAQFDD